MSSRLIRGDIEKRIAAVAWRAPRCNQTAEETPPPETNSRHAPAAALEEQVKDSYHRGLQEGRQLARQESQEETGPLADRLEEIVASFSALQDDKQKENEKQLVELSLAVAKRILHRELSVDPEAVSALVKAALERIGSREVRRIRVCPKHKEFVRSIVERACPAKNVELIADEALTHGSLLFETEHGDLDASIDTQLEEIRRGLADRL